MPCPRGRAVGAWRRPSRSVRIRPAPPGYHSITGAGCRDVHITAEGGMNFFDDWVGIARILIFAALAYAALVLVLRTSGKRTLGKMNAFDLVITVALGSTLAAAVLDASVPLAESVLAFAALAGLQAAVAYGQTRSPRIEALVKSEPSLVVRDGRILRGVLRRERLTESEVMQAVRASGRGGLEDVAAVVLETDGSLSVIGSGGRAVASAEGEASA
jgi:uncharacterized membrane protein YcaP (DUF421 family)